MEHIALGVASLRQSLLLVLLQQIESKRSEYLKKAFFGKLLIHQIMPLY